MAPLFAVSVHLICGLTIAVRAAYRLSVRNGVSISLVKSMESFKYEPVDLDGPAIRLLVLPKGDGFDIECNLIQAWLHSDDTIPYEALSYTWGSTELGPSIMVNGKPLKITENLVVAIRHLRSRETDRTLWVDGICIDQSHDRERGHQVQQMGDIYRQAQQVLIWLGPSMDYTSLLLAS